MKKLLILCLSVFSISFLPAQNAPKEEQAPAPLQNMSKDADKLIKKGHYNSALAILAKIVQKDTTNFNTNFKLGLCYYYSMDDQLQAMVYFQRASQNMSTNYSFGKSTEAPYAALYYLAETQLAAKQVDAALASYLTYRDVYKGTPPKRVDNKILSCVNAKRYYAQPRDVSRVKFGKGINTDYTEMHPVLTLDASVLFFSTRRPRSNPEENPKVDVRTGKLTEDIYMTNKGSSGNWREPKLFKHTTQANEAPLCLSSDGLTLYFRSDEKGNFDLYSSNFQDGVWQDPVALGSNINSGYDETGLSVSGDGNRLYFVSDREGGQGGFDIYQVFKSESGKWGKAQNLGPDVNTSFDETSPFIHPNGKNLFFSSKGFDSKGMGGYDVYYTEMQDDGSWSNPENMGYPINTTRDDLNYYITSGGIRYYASIDKDISYDLYKIKGGGFDFENMDVDVGVISLTKEMAVTEVLEVEKEIEKEIEVVEFVETEIEVEKEVEVIDLTALDELELADEERTALAQAEAELKKAEAEIAIAKAIIAEAELKKARVEIAAAEAETAKAEAAKAEAEAEIKKAEAEKLKAEAEIAVADAARAKSEAEKAVSDEAIAKANAKKAEADAIIAEADQKKAEAESKKADAEKAKADASKAKTDLKTEKVRVKTLKSEEKIAEAEKTKAQAEIANVEKAKALAEKAKSDEIAASKLAEAEKAKAEAQKAKAEAETATAKAKQAEADKAKAEAEAAGVEKAKAAADKSRAEAEQAKAEAERARAAAQKAASDKATEQAKAQSKQAEAGKARADADKASADAEQEKAAAARAKSEADKAKSEADKARSEADKAKADAEKAKAKQKK